MQNIQKVAILSYNGQALFELGCAVELFSLPRPEIKNWYEGEVVNFDNEAHAATGGVMLSSKHISDFRDYSTIVVPSWHIRNVIPAQLYRAIQEAYVRGARILSFCSGAFLLAETGVLQGRKAITHWRYADEFRKRYPHISFSDKVLFEYDGQIGCSAGSAAGLDLGLEIIRQDFGYKVANKVARRLVISAQRDGGQAQYVETPVVQRHSSMSKVVDWALANLDKFIDVSTLADKAHMSRRSFDRKFKQSFGLPPKSWLIEQRLQRVLHLLENESSTIEDIAVQSGFESGIAMRHHFRKRFNVSPTQYRANLSVVPTEVIS